jgi:hypothetical protein
MPHQEQRREREAFFTNEIPYLLPSGSHNLLLAGDFNCVTTPSDCTGSPNISKALYSLITGLALNDVYDARCQHPPYTHYTNNGATRIDRVYVTDTLMTRKKDADTIIAPFSDHMTVVVKLTYPYQAIPLRMRLWKMNTSLLNDGAFRGTLKHLWTKWRTLVRYFPNKSVWWDRYTKKRIKTTFLRENAAQTKDRKDMEEFYYDALYHAIQTNTNTEKRAITIRRLKAKLLRVMSQNMGRVLLDTYVRHPQHTQTGSNSSTIAAESSNGVTNTRCCRYSCMRS